MWTVKGRSVTVNLLWVREKSKSYPLGCRWSQPSLGSTCSISALYQSTLLCLKTFGQHVNWLLMFFHINALKALGTFPIK